MLKTKESGEMFNLTHIIKSINQAKEYSSWMQRKRKEKNVQLELRVSELASQGQC